MDWKQLLFTHKGRIGRKHFWLSQLIMLVASFAVGLAAILIFGPLTGASGEDTGATAALDLMLRLAFVYPAACINAKRLHDLDRSGWWQLLPIALLVAYLVGVAIAVTTITAGGGDFVIGLLAFLLIIVALALALWVGCARGTPGPNRFGEPDSGARKVTPLAEVFS